jgi:hypothetical protein
LCILRYAKALKHKDSQEEEGCHELAKSIVDQATGEAEPEPEPKPDPDKDPAAVALGRKGGKKGGKARAANMTPEERSEAARKAALARWAKERGSED